MSALEFAGPVDGILSWVHPEPAFMQRAGHAIAVDGRVWVVDPPDGDGLADRIRDLGEPAAILQLLDRHPRDCQALASQLGVPLRSLPFDGEDGAPFEAFTVWRLPLWKEVGLWFPGTRTLVVPEALAGAPAFVAPGEEVGVHPMRRLLPPRELARYDVEHLLLGHGPAHHGTAARELVREALDGSRRRAPAMLAAQLGRAVRGRLRS